MGLTYIQILNEAPRRGDASIILAHALIPALLNSGADPVLLAGSCRSKVLGERLFWVSVCYQGMN